MGKTYKNDVNEVIVSGNIGKAPEFRVVRETPVCNLSVASNSTINGQSTPEWHRIVAFNGLAEVIRNNGAVGRKVVVLGRLRTRSFQGDVQMTLDGRKVTGKATRYITEIIAREVIWMDRNPNSRNDFNNSGYYNNSHGEDNDTEIPF